MGKKPAERILAADDDATSRKLLARILYLAGYSCTQISDEIEVLASLHAEPSSLLLLDFDMPGMDGAGILKQLRQDAKPSIAHLRRPC